MRRLDLRVCTTLLLAVLLLPVAGWAQAATGSIAGKVTDSDGRGLEAVAVTIPGVAGVVLTDDQGEFVINGVPEGTHTVRLVMGTDSTTRENVAVSSGATARLDVQVDWRLSFADTLVVTGVSRQAERIVEAPAAVTIVGAEEIRDQASHGQLPKLLEFTPGVEITQSGIYDFNLNTRGFNSSLNRRVVTLVDGRDPSVPFLGAQEWAAISFPLDDLSNAELVRGPSSALYGANAFNGVLNLTTKSPKTSQGGEIRVTAGELATLNLDFRIAGELGGDWYYKAVAGYRESEDFTTSRNLRVEYPGLPREAIPLVLEDDNEVTLGGLRLDKYLSNGHIATVEAGYAELQGPAFQTGIGRVQLVDVERPWARVNYNAPRINFLAYWDGRDGVQRSLASGQPLFLDSTTYSAELQGNLDFAEGKGRIVGGISYNDEEIDTADANGRQTLTFAKVDSQAEAAFAQVEYDPTDRIHLVLAGRYDDSTLHDAQFSPKAAIVWQVKDGHALRFSYNEAFQVANYSEFFLQARTTLPGTTISAINLAALEQALAPLLGGVSLGFRSIPVMALGNENLDLEEIQTFEVGYIGSLGNNGVITLDYYNSNSENFISDLLPNLSAGRRLNGQFGAYTPPAQLSATARQAVLTQLANLAATNPALRGVLPFLSNNLDGAPIIALATYTNFGEVESQGVEFGINYRLNDWQFRGAYTWSDFDVVDTNGLPASQLEPNTPENSFSLGLGYSADRFDVSVGYRWVDDFRWIVGPFNGIVESYNLVDVSGNFDVTPQFRVGVNVSNLLDEEHWQAFGGDILGRRALASLSYSW